MEQPTPSYNTHDFWDRILGIEPPHNRAAVEAVDMNLFKSEDREEQDFCDILAETYRLYVQEELGLEWNHTTGLCQPPVGKTMTKEYEWYEQNIAPELRAIAKKCKEKGFDYFFLTRVNAKEKETNTIYSQDHRLIRISPGKRPGTWAIK